MNEYKQMTLKNSVTASDVEIRIEDILDRMSLEDMVTLLSGEDFWSVAALPEHGIGKLRVTDGPNGARGSGSFFQDGGERVSSASFPVGIALGASWDPDLVEQIGRAIADETKSKGAQVCLAPTVNIHRSVTNGRNFECYSEDPELSADLTAAFVKGLQSKGVAATVKHFAGNESEIERTTINSKIDERSLREVYLRPFEDAVKKADAWGIMTSYNKLNGTYSAENEWLLEEVLRGDWGFDGFVVSDWFGSRTTAPTVNAGLDLEMPGPTRDRGEKLIAAIEAGEVSEQTVRERARTMLRVMQRVGCLDEMPEYTEITEDRPEHRALIRKAGAECAVLLKNNKALPLKSDKGIAVIGPNAKVAQIMGGGSSQLNPHYRVSPWDGLVNRLGAEALAFAPGCQNHRWEPLLHGDILIEFFARDDLGGEVVATSKLTSAVEFLYPEPVEGKIAQNDFSCRASVSYTAEATGPHSFGLHTAGKSRLKVNGEIIIDIWDDWEKGRTFFEEGCDERTGLIDLVEGETYLVEMELQTVPAANLVNPAFRFGVSQPLGDAAIAKAVEVAKDSETVLLFVGRSGEWDTEGSDLDHIKLPGRQDKLVNAVAAANPNTIVVLQTGGPVEMPWLDDVAAVLQAWYPGQELGNAVADMLFGDVEPTGRLPQTFPKVWQDNPTQSDDAEVYPGKDGNVRYDEGVFIGYRHYDAKAIEPMFPFGFGLGYTEFTVKEMSVLDNDGSVIVDVKVRNTGNRCGTTVVQLYVGDDAASVPRPEKELKGYQKVTVAAQETETISILLEPRDFAFFDVETDQWKVEEGTFTLSAGFSCKDIQATATLHRNTQLIGK
jgi:beta-glucosidase